MKRYEHWCSLDGGGMGEPEEAAGGDWVRYEDAAAAVAAERARCAALDAGLQSVLDWARTEKSPLREQEIASIVAVLAKYRA